MQQQNITQQDLLIVGAGAAGMMCALQTAHNGLRVTLFDHANKIGEKIRISGGGRCNFTNLNLNHGDPSRFYLSAQPRFVRHALSRYTPDDFIHLLKRHQIDFHEKHKGQLFCTHSANDLIEMLKTECARGQVAWQIGEKIDAVQVLHHDERPIFQLQTASGIWQAPNLVIATGGLAAPAIGATAWGYEIAKQFGHSVIAPQAALVPLRFEGWQEQGLDQLAGIALPVRISTGVGKQKMCFDEDLLFRHKGLSGPAVLQISSYWQAGQTIQIDFCPDVDVLDKLLAGKNGSKLQLNNALKQICPHLPERLILYFLSQPNIADYAHKKWADVPSRVLQQLAQQLKTWTLLPSGSDGHKKAEVTRGGVNVKEIDAQTMQSRLQTGLYFIGEVMDITGWLGGYNFQWAWASGVCAAKHLIEQHFNSASNAD
ncbi:MAG: NAD(P)/FAD-dependent oxidoreductase [Neisseria sp.]|nr:NAD(P)/FAD-dependent oxidoreductase [Neisseria sp.]